MDPISNHINSPQNVFIYLPAQEAYPRSAATALVSCETGYLWTGDQWPSPFYPNLSMTASSYLKNQQNNMQLNQAYN